MVIHVTQAQQVETPHSRLNGITFLQQLSLPSQIQIVSWVTARIRVYTMLVVNLMHDSAHSDLTVTHKRLKTAASSPHWHWLAKSTCRLRSAEYLWHNLVQAWLTEAGVFDASSQWTLATPCRQWPVYILLCTVWVLLHSASHDLIQYWVGMVRCMILATNLEITVELLHSEHLPSNNQSWPRKSHQDAVLSNGVRLSMWDIEILWKNWQDDCIPLRGRRNSICEASSCSSSGKTDG